MPDDLPSPDLHDPLDSAGDSAFHRFTVPPELAGARLDRAATQLAAEAGLPLSRARLQELLADGRVLLDGRNTPASRKVAAGQAVSVEVPPAIPATPEPQDIPLEIVFEDDWLLVVNKPTGMVVHPAAGNADGTLVNALLFHCAGRLSGIGGVARPGIVHRLDKDTSGLMAVAKKDAAHNALAAQFADRSIGRTYGALCWNLPSPTTGRIEGNIGRDPHDRQRMAVTPGGKPAATHYVLREGFGPPDGLAQAALLDCTLETGRTHQIRVHLAASGHPLLNDPLYGNARFGQKRLSEAGQAAVSTLPGQALHAHTLKFIHPERGEPMQFFADYPEAMQAVLASLRLATSWRSAATQR